ncbi:TetR/AcrR family transcriptional regulator [Poseidonocella sp. HB161398]|uniref:TetR/AcrR family transcriptional regulator n=1 Tax=Poseidonocella sp. HB161398 TaxID=2320855 RepID=UPI001107F8E1|nr:TetR/AcrR family transcriptional regulator [Poseidonocella sp. HB161398]
MARKKALATETAQFDHGYHPEPGSPPDLMCRAALDLFAEHSYSSVRIKDIAEASGFNPSHFYYYFDNKEDLFMKTIARVVAEAFSHFDGNLKRAGAPEEVISSWIELHIRQFVALQKVARISLDYAATGKRTPVADRAIRAFYEHEAEILKDAIQRGIAEGVFADANPADTATLISTFLDGALFRNVMFPNFNYARAMQGMRKMVLHWLKTGGRPA